MKPDKCDEAAQIVTMHQSYVSINVSHNENLMHQYLNVQLFIFCGHLHKGSWLCQL